MSRPALAQRWRDTGAPVLAAESGVLGAWTQRHDAYSEPHEPTARASLTQPPADLPS